MTNFHRLIDWVGNHQLLYTFILFLLAAALSIYAQDIRLFLHRWPRTKVQEFNRNRISERLKLLRSINGSAYHLLFYFALQFLQMVLEFLLLAVGYTIYSALGPGTARMTILIALFSGAFIGRCNSVREVMKQLSKYDQSVSALEQQR